MQISATIIPGILSAVLLSGCDKPGADQGDTDQGVTDTDLNQYRSDLRRDKPRPPRGKPVVVDTDVPDTDVPPDTDVAGGDTDPGDTEVPRTRPVIFVLAFENKAASQIYGNYSSAPYINDVLFPLGTHATNFLDDLPSRSSEPHYVWMQAGTNKFSDHEFTNNDDPSGTNSTSTSLHLVNQIDAAGLSWMSYQEGMNSNTGACPIDSSGFYKAKHNPFVFFTDITNDPPSKTASRCVAHHKPLTRLKDDLANGTVADYNFITPDQCHDMHGQTGCPGESDHVMQGDDWLAANLPPILAYANTHNGVVLLIWDEPASTGDMPFIALGPKVKQRYATNVQFGHSSLVRTVEGILGLPELGTVRGANDFSDVFIGNTLP